MERKRYAACAVVALFGTVNQGYAVGPQTRAAERPAEIDAKCWFNAQPVRLYRAPRLILLEFWSMRSRQSRRFVEVLAEFHRAYRDGRLLVVALTDDECDDARAFIRREKIPYKVGAQSRSATRYGVEELPAVVLIDPKEHKIVARWSGRELKAKAIRDAIVEFLGPPVGTWQRSPDALTEPESKLFYELVAQANEQLVSITADILARESMIGPEDLADLDRFYADNLPGNADQDRAVTRAQDTARSMILGPDLDVGYGKLFSSGRLSEEGKTAIRDRALKIAAEDPSDGLRIDVVGALRQFIGQAGDPVLLEGLRSLREREGSPYVRATIDYALEKFDTERASRMKNKAPRLHALKLKRMLNFSPDPASTPWADAYAYKQTAADRTTEQLLEDYWAFPDPPDDEIGRQNARLKRDAVQDEIQNRILRGEIRDLRLVKEHLARALFEEPDPYIRKYLAVDLVEIAKRGGRGIRAEVVELFQKRLPLESRDHYVRAELEQGLKDLKGQ